MHIEYHPFRPPQPNRWVVIDDFGTEHDSLWGETATFGDYSADPHARRRDFIESQEQDPDYFRHYNSRPETHSLDEPTTWSTPFGLSVEGYLSIAFLLIPAWDERYGKAHFTREAGARIEVRSVRTDRFSFGADPVVLYKPELIDYCWEYLALERARERAESLAASEAA